MSYIVPIFDEELRPLFRNGEIPTVLKFVFLYLWLRPEAGNNNPGRRPKADILSALEVALAFSVDPRTAREWLEKLAKLGLIEIIDRDKKRGVYSILIFHPNPGERYNTYDPQLLLPLALNQPAREDGVTSPDPHGHHGSVGDPGVLSPANPSLGNAENDPLQGTPRGNLRKLPRDCPSNSEEFAQKTPRLPLHGGTFCAKNPAGKPAQISPRPSPHDTPQCSSPNPHHDNDLFMILDDAVVRIKNKIFDWTHAEEKFRQIVHLLFSFPEKISEDDGAFLLCVAVLSEHAFSEGWLTLKEVSAAKRATKTKVGYLRNTLAKRLYEWEGIAAQENYFEVFNQAHKFLKHPVAEYFRLNRSRLLPSVESTNAKNIPLREPNEEEKHIIRDLTKAARKAAYSRVDDG